MALITRDNPVQDCAAAHLRSSGHHGFDGGEHDPCRRRYVPAEAYVLLTVQPRLATGSLASWSCPPA